MTGPLTLSAHLSNGAATSCAVGGGFPSEDGGRSDRREGRGLLVSLSLPILPTRGMQGGEGREPSAGDVIAESTDGPAGARSAGGQAREREREQ